ncbi:hypothetical protein D3C87_2158060 [compost metagenome]
MQAEAARALGRWEPRLTLDQVRVISVIGGQINLKVVGKYQGDGVMLEVGV